MCQITCYKKYKIRRTTLSEVLETCRNVPVDVRPVLDSYYLLYWSAEYFLNQYHAGTVIHGNRLFHVVFTPETSLGRIKSLCSIDKQAQIRLSFRVPPVEFELPNTLLVSIAPAVF